MRKTILFLVLVLILLTSCSKQTNITGKIVSIPKEEMISEKGEMQVFFCPKDDSSKVLEDNNQLTHNKFCIFDGQIITTGSFNPTERGAFNNNNNLVIVRSKYLAENYEDEFNELWQGFFSRGEKVKYPEINVSNIIIENYFCPEDNCRKQVIEEIQKAKKSMYFMTFSFTDEEVADAILFSDVTDIKGIFEKVQAGSEYSQYKRLKDFGLNVKLDKNPYNMHHKVFIIDKETVITGSYNPTGAGHFKNDENILIIHDKEIANEFIEEFNSLFE